MRYADFCCKITWRLLSGAHTAQPVRSLSSVYKTTPCKFTTVYGGIRTLCNMAAKLRLVQFISKDGGGRRVGVELQDRSSVVDITAVNPSIPRDMRSFLESWDTSVTAASE